MSSAAEMSDLVCRCRGLSGARAVITQALFTHRDTHSVESFFTTRRTFAEIFFVLFSLYIKLIKCSPELPAAPLWSQLSLLRLPLPGIHQRCTPWPIVEVGGREGVNGTSVTSSRNLGIFRVFFLRGEARPELPK